MIALICNERHGPQAVGLLLRRLSSLLQRRSATRHSGHEVSYVQWVALTYIRDGGAATPGDLARELGISGSAATRVADGLESQGLIERVRSAIDRRFVFLGLTPAGRAKTEGSAPTMLSIWSEVIDGIEPSEFDQAVRVLDRLQAALEASADMDVEQLLRGSK
jgi:DNA-binding MarR family transcriptional regulator